MTHSTTSTTHTTTTRGTCTAAAAAAAAATATAAAAAATATATAAATATATTADGEWADGFGTREVDEGSSDRGHESAEISAAELGRRLPRLGERRLSERVPALYPLAVRYHRARRRVQWMRSHTEFARSRATDDLPVGVKRHTSLLMRQLGETELWMQRNEVINLELACAQVDGLLIRPGETFSFNQVVGNPTRRKGYVQGVRLSNGKASPGIGGGICQLANLLHWMVLHSPLTVTERSTHSFDPFPDSGRVLPWGVGCSIVYNYVDLQVRNDTDRTFQLRVGVGDRYLEGEILADAPTRASYRVFARGEHFLRAGDEYFRRNEIWRTTIDRRTGNPVGDELIRENVALVRYVPTDVHIIDVDLRQYPPAS